MYVYTNLSAREGSDTRSIFKMEFNGFEFSYLFLRPVAMLWLKSPVCPTIYL